MKKLTLTTCLVFVAISISGQSGAVVPEPLAAGLEAFEQRDFSRAAALFQQSIEAPGESYDGHAQYWLGRTLMALNELEPAADVFDLFLASYSQHPYEEETRYQRARIFFLNDRYEAAVQQFSRFLSDYPESAFEPNAIYWSGESLLALGRLDAAEQLFREVTVRFPSSFRYEAAQYRLDVLDLKRRENELLTLLQWSHEEYLQALELFEQREAQYREALRSYRSQIAGTAAVDAQSIINELETEVGVLQQTVANQRDEINRLLSEARQSQAPATERTESPQPDAEMREALDSLRLQALELQQILLEQQEQEEGQ